jgi:hypothetical protein
MNKAIRMLTVLVLLVVLLPANDPVEAQQSYLLVCRGGGDMHFTYTPFSNFSRDPQLWIRFDPGSEGVGSGWNNINSLRPGQCSWLDRGLRSGEPTRIIILNPLLDTDEFSIQWMRGQVTGISSSLYYINGLQNEDEYQSFRVYNDGEDNLVVTEIDEGTNTLGAPEHTSPPDGMSFDHYPRETTLQWKSVDGAASYTVEVDCLHCCRSGWWCDEFDEVWLVRSGIQNTEFTFNFVGAQPGRWRVWAVYSNGNESAKSRWSEFEYTQ